MRRNRLILAAVIIAAGIFVSFYGGNFPYALFYLTLAIPFVSFFYTFYVYQRVRVYQNIELPVIIKGQSSGYNLNIANEDHISYQNLRVNFYTGTSTVQDAGQCENYCLLPGESAGMETNLRCHFRGVYPVGVRSIEITDVFNLFGFSYPIRSRNEVTVLPRRVKLGSLSLIPFDEDAKNTPFQTRAKEEELDIEMRRYIRGDSPRQIHWKSTAKRGELMSRRYTENMRLGVMLIMDLSPTGIRELLERAEIEDRVIESSIAIADYCLGKRIPCEIRYFENGIQYARADRVENFEEFYTTCARLGFESKTGAGELAQAILGREVGIFRYIVVTHKLTGALYSAATDAVSRGNSVTVVLMRDLLDEEQTNIKKYMSAGSIPVVQVTNDEEFASVFERTPARG